MTFQGLEQVFYHMYNKIYYGNIFNNPYNNWKNVCWKR